MYFIEVTTDSPLHIHMHDTHNQCHLLFLQWMREHSRLPRSESALVEVFLGTLSQDGDTFEALSKELVDSCWASLYSENFVFESTPPAAGRERGQSYFSTFELRAKLTHKTSLANRALGRRFIMLCISHRNSHARTHTQSHTH